MLIIFFEGIFYGRYILRYVGGFLYLVQIVTIFFLILWVICYTFFVKNIVGILMSEFSPFSKLQKRTVEVNFNGGSISGDAGVLLLREVDKKSGLTKYLPKCFLDCRDQGKVIPIAKNN